jgi:hypothetical protein
MNIKDLKAKEVKSAMVTYDEDFKVKFNLNYIEKSEMTRLNGQFTRTKFNPKSHSKEEELDIEGLRKRICEIGVSGWAGVTPRWLSTVMPIDADGIGNMDEEIAFSQENLTDLCDAIYGLDGWIFENVRNGEHFNKNQAHKDDQVKN